MQIVKFGRLLAALIAVGCVSVQPGGSPGASTGLGSPAASPSAATTSEPLVTAAPTSPVSLPPASQPPTVEPPVTQAPVTEPPATAKPTKRPTPAPIPIDLSIFIYGADIPNPWYTNTDYTMPIYVTVTGDRVPSARVKVSVPEEAFSTNFDTGPILPADNYYHDVVFNLVAMGPATLTMSVKAPAGYVDIDPSNNKLEFPITVLPKP